ncbi:membrane protein [Candidatus Magnetobacterium bavaricum]|uniref:Membrane protein n=1 Tax=Candidatus Magnetobacterium bavaricum TaxID=29290 RepID=A0A0F3GQF8_9BACT|nr:membrane protein [Candidatus Magnetobacterium bavaricum]
MKVLWCISSSASICSKSILVVESASSLACLMILLYSSMAASSSLIFFCSISCSVPWMSGVSGIVVGTLPR